MYKSSALLILLILSSLLLAGEGSGITAKIGITRSGFKDDSMDSLYTYNGDPVPANCRIMPSFEVAYEYAFSDILSLTGGVGVKFIGNQFKADGSSGALNDSLKLTTLTIPIDIKATLPTTLGGVYLTFRPQGGIILSSEFAGADYKGSLSTGFDFSLGFRIGGEIHMKKSDLILESGMDWGLSEVYDDTIAQSKTCTINLFAVGFRFHLPKE